MRTALTVALTLQLMSGLLWTLAVAGSPGRGDFGLLGLLVVVYAVQLPAALLGLWALWRHPELRKLAGLVAVSPVVFWFFPGIVKQLAGGHLSADELALIALTVAVLILAACFLLPRKVSGILPAFLFRSRVLNGLVLASLTIGWLAPVGVILFILSSGRTSAGSDTGEGLAMGIVFVAMYLLFAGAGSLFGAAWGWLGLWSGIEGATRKLHIAQIVAAIPAALLGAAALAFVASQN